MRDPPSGRVPEQGPDWFLVATEACGGGTPDLFCSPMVLGYMEIYRQKKSVRGATRVEGAPPPSWAPRGSPDVLLRLYISIYPKNIGEQNRSGVLPPQASVATKNLSGARSGTLPEGSSEESTTHKGALGGPGAQVCCAHLGGLLHRLFAL